MTSELSPTVRILARLTKKWMGSGFLVPSPPGDPNIHVMTCAHVVADALGKTDLKFLDAPPDRELSVLFNAAEDGQQGPFTARVAAGGWTPISAETAYDIAVLRLDITDLPRGVELPKFVTSVSVNTPVMAFGPRYAEDLSQSADGYWTQGEILGQARAKEIEFLSGDVIPEDNVIGGYSGSALTVRSTLEIAGMVRVVTGKTKRNCFGLPVSMLLTVWEHLKYAVPGPGTGNRADAVFDLIDRQDQVLALTGQLRKMLKQTDNPVDDLKLVFTIAGDPDEDHGHLGRRLRLEVSSFDLRGNDINVSEVVLKLRRGKTLDDCLTLMLDQLRVEVKAPGISPEELGVAMAQNAGQMGGWMIQLLLPPDLTADQEELLRAFLDVWIDIAAVVKCEIYLGVFFGYCPDKTPGVKAADIHKSLKSHDVGSFDLVPLRSLTRFDLDEWPDNIMRHGHLDHEADAIKLMRAVRRLIPSGANISMTDLMDAIDEAEIDPSSFQSL